ncbi:MAG: 30S ribosomal protein S6 [Ignavibacteria bacterium]|jgi:small subunit ribosomal protein S6
MTNRESKTYETIFILDAMLDDDNIESIINKFSTFLNKNDCSIVKVDKWGRKKFAYPIKKKYTGYYVSIDFTTLTNTIVTKLDRAYHLDENVLRFLTVNFDKKTLAERKAYFDKKEMDLANITKEREAAEAKTEVPELETENPEKQV